MTCTNQTTALPKTGHILRNKIAFFRVLDVILPPQNRQLQNNNHPSTEITSISLPSITIILCMDKHSSDVESSATISSRDLQEEDDHFTMVSALTGRLFAAGGHDVASLDSFKKRKAEPMMSSTNTSGGSSGYAADVDQVSKAGQLPSYVDLLMRPKGDAKVAIYNAKTEIAAKGGLDKLSAKRRKIIEREFTAHTVKEALARGGLTMPAVQLSRPRVLPPLCGVDMSRVSLVKSSDFSFLKSSGASDNSKYTKKNGAFGKHNNKKQEDKEICFESIISLTEACKAFYKLPPATEQEDTSRSDDNSTNGSTASSVTDSDPDCESEEGSKPFMAMCEALSLCKQPR